jgi:hypothetical protein
MKSAGLVARIGEILGKPEERRALGRSGLRKEDNIKMNFQDVRYGA